MRKSDPKEVPLRVLVEADPGTGKTRFIDTANAHERTSPLLHLDIRGNTISLLAVTEWEHHIAEIESTNDISKVYNELAGSQTLAELFPGIVFRSVAIDQITELHHILLREIMGYKEISIASAKAQPQIQHWGELLRRTNFLIGTFLGLPMHVFLAVQSAEKQDQTTGAIMHRPQLWGKSEKEVPAYVYIHMYLIQAARLTRMQKAKMGLEEVDDLDRIGLFQPRFDSMAKDQYGKLGSHMINPTVSQVVEKIYG